MSHRLSKIAAGLAAAALVGGAGAAAAAQNGDGGRASGGGVQRMRGPGGPGGGADLSALASELGVSTARLREAFASAFRAGPRGDMATALAEALDLPVERVEAALREHSPDRGGGPPDGSAPPSAPNGPGNEGTRPAVPGGSTRQP